MNKGVVEVEVIHHYPGDRTRDRRPVAGVTASLGGGPSARNPGDTTGGGKYRFRPVTPSPGYSVTVAFTAEQQEKFDLNAINPAMAQQLPVTGGNTTVYLFEVPGYWLEFIVQDALSNPLANVSWLLEHRPLGGAYARLESGVSGPTGQIYRYPVKRGRYKLTLRTLANPVWSGNRGVIGTPITMSADVTGPEPGVNGRFDILDAFDLANVLDSVPSRTRPAHGGPVIEATWTPKAGTLNALRHNRIRFRAHYETATAISAPLPVFQPEKVKTRELSGAGTDLNVRLHFSGGSHTVVNTAGGQADVEIPWGDTVTRISLPAEHGVRVRAEGIGLDGNLMVPLITDIV